MSCAFGLGILLCTTQMRDCSSESSGTLPKLIRLRCRALYMRPLTQKRLSFHCKAERPLGRGEALLYIIRSFFLPSCSRFSLGDCLAPSEASVGVLWPITETAPPQSRETLLPSSADMAEELRVPAPPRHPDVRPALGEGHTVSRRCHAAFLRDPSNRSAGPDHHRVSGTGSVFFSFL